MYSYEGSAHTTLLETQSEMSTEGNDVMQVLKQQHMNPEVATAATVKLLAGLMSKGQTEEIEDDRYAFVISRKQSRFTSTLSEDSVLSLEIHPLGKSVAYSRADGSLTIWLITGPSFARSKKIYILNAAGGDKCITSLSWNSNEINQLATVSHSSEVFIWAIDDRRKNASKIRTISVRARQKLFKCQYDPTGKWLVTVAKSGELHLFDVRKDHELQNVFDLNQIIPDDSIRSVSWNNSGSHLFIGLKSGKLALFEVTESGGLELILCLQAHRDAITSLAVDPWGRSVITGSTDGTCAVWDLTSMCCSLLIHDLNASVVSVDIDHLGKALAICTDKGELQLRDIDSGFRLHDKEIRLGGSEVITRFYPNKSWLISSTRGDLLQNHFTPSAYDSPTGLWKVEYEKNILGSRIKNTTSKISKKGRESRDNIKNDRSRASKRDQPWNGRFAGRR